MFPLLILKSNQGKFGGRSLGFFTFLNFDNEIRVKLGEDFPLDIDLKLGLNFDLILR